MFRINLPGSNGYLLLIPQLGGLSRIVQALILAAAFGLLFFLIVRLYRYELRFIPKRYAHGLLAVRLLTVGLIVIVVGLRPSVRFVTREVIPSHVLVAIDRSNSMNVADPQRDLIEKLELARRLKLASDLANDATLAAWIEQLRQATMPSEPSFRQVVERVDGTSRLALAERVLAPDGIDLLRLLGEHHKLQIVAFDQQLGDLPSNVEAIRSALRTGKRVQAEAATDLNLPLSRGLELRDELKEGLVGIIMLSDGQHNWGGIPSELAYRLGHAENRTAVPVYTIVCGAKIPPTDLAIISAKATPPIVFKQGNANIDLRLQANNLPAGKIKVTIAYSDAPDQPRRPPIIEFIEHDGVSAPPPRTIPVKMERAAIEKLTVTVEAIEKDGKKIDDRFPENNSKQVVVHVAPDKAKVLLVDGEARWEQHYLQTALLRDPTMETKSVVFEQPRLAFGKVNDLAALKLPDTQLPGPEDLPRYDCIILGDVSPEQLPREERERLEKFVADRGGTLVILAGKRSMPLEFLDPDDPLARMLPVTNPRVLDMKTGFKAALTGEGLQTGFLRLEPEAALSADRWSNLPPHYWAIVGKARGGAVALAHVPSSDKKASREQERDDALIVRQNHGFGQVVYVGLDSTWRWRFKQGDKYHHRFWSQLIRWAASDRALIAGNAQIRFGVRQPVYRGDQEVEMLVRVGEESRKLAKDAIVAARLFRKTNANDPEEAAALTPLKLNPEVPGQFEGMQANLPPGDYTMELVIPDLDDQLNGPDGRKLRASFKVLPPDTGEMLNLATNWERMNEIADHSGGLMVSADKAGDLIDQLKSRQATREFTTEKNLGQSWWLLTPLLALLTAEWLLRKWVGLA